MLFSTFVSEKLVKGLDFGNENKRKASTIKLPDKHGYTLGPRVGLDS